MTINKIILLFVLAVFSFATIGFVFHAESVDGMLRTFNVKIEKTDDGTWRVRDNNGRNKGTLSVERGDTINWQAKGSDLVFIFSKEVENYFEYEGSMFEDGRTQKILNNKKLRLTLKEDAPQGLLPYEVYVITEGKSVVGNSPPRLIIN
ncbi:hypothetical protein [Fodinibius sp. SL11]|uniref:hypothetical protein n=1 Tax=Fodinibius sp. SL11 TaxID=3425690 RepID=UPI003F883AEC